MENQVYIKPFFNNKLLAQMVEQNWYSKKTLMKKKNHIRFEADGHLCVPFAIPPSWHVFPAAQGWVAIVLWEMFVFVAFLLRSCFVSLSFAYDVFVRGIPFKVEYRAEMTCLFVEIAQKWRFSRRKNWPRWNFARKKIDPTFHFCSKIP